MELSGTHIFITGAGQRIAKYLAERLLEYPVKVTLHARRSKAHVEALQKEALKRGLDWQVTTFDLTESQKIKLAVTESVTKLGPIDILINSASNFFPTPAKTCTEEDWNALTHVNSRGPFFVCQAMHQALRGKRGLIVNLADVNAERPLIHFGPYCAAKAGLLMSTKSLALEWAPQVRVNAISPGPVLPPTHFTETQIKKAAQETLLGRWGSPEDIWEAFLFLVRNDYVTGLNLRVDGGKSLL